MNKLIRVRVDPRVDKGNYVIGGVRLIMPKDDRDLGKELRTTEIRCHDEQDAQRAISKIKRTEGLELTR